MYPPDPFHDAGEPSVSSRPFASSSSLSDLNASQRTAVEHADGPVLVLAGAGSGKTRVITRRIAWLISERGAPPWSIVAVTFTNKAAGEMRERVETLLGGVQPGSWIGTFHAMCLRILRREGQKIGLGSGFNIYDSDDQHALVRRLLKEESDDLTVKPRAVLGRISRAKNNLEPPEDMASRAYSPERELTARIYRSYQDALRRANAVDFDDLLVRTLELFEGHPETLRAYAERTRHLLVDEYQDTNRPQYLLIRALTSVHGNLFVVGDEDQSIYRFRGAEIRNILDFEHDHPGADVIRLEQNYRSTGMILDVAAAVIAHNVHRKGKTLWTENPRGDRVKIFRAPDDRDEATWVAERIRTLTRGDEYDGVAILYRTNAQSRQFEEIFRRDRIPYRVIGSVQFYERREVKDLLAYLKLIANPSDDVSFRRVVNTPTRGIGETSLRTIGEIARGLGVPLMEATAHALEQNLITTRAARNVGVFLDLMAELFQLSEDADVETLLDTVVDRVGYEEFLEKSYPGQGHERMDNARALISAAAEYFEEDPEPSLLGFLDRSALVSDTDDLAVGGGVTLMTIHCAKGLEFETVFLVGLEENLFPHSRSIGQDDDLEEERRLCYVAMTRAGKRLFLTHAAIRRFQGSFLPNPPSRFLSEIPPDLVQDVSPRSAGLFERPVGWNGDTRRPSSGSSAARVASHRKTAAPASPPGPATPVDDGYTVGRDVRHPKFGTGRIVGREGSGRNLKLSIDFRDHGSKKILPAYTKLMVEA